METNPFILALSKTLPESCLQGLAVYLILQLLFYIDKRSTPSLKFNLYYAANLCLFAGFILTFFHHYQQIQVNAFDPNLLPDKVGNNIATKISKPNLWLQFSFWTSRYAYLITGFYLIGLLFCILKLTIGLVNINWFRNHRNLKLDDYLSNVSIKLSSNFRLIKTASVYLSDKICVPLTLGFIKPIIVFPIALINQLSAEQTEAILLHELAHIKRNDYLLNMLLCIVQSFLFFNPAIWLMEREINKYREQCCDDLVLDNTQHKIAYARALLLIEENRNAQLTLALASNGKKYTLLNRIKRITNMKINEPSPQNKLVLLLFALIILGVVVACNLPEKKAVKHYKAKRLSYTIYHTTQPGFNPAEPYSEWSADTMKIMRKSKQDSFVLYTNKIIFKPNKKYSKKYIFSGNRLIVNEFSDIPIRSKAKFKIAIEDSTGNKKEYNSISELPIEDQKEFTKQNKKLNKHNDISLSVKFPDSTKYTYQTKFIDSVDLKKQTKEMVLIVKKQIADYKKRNNILDWKDQDKNRKKVVDSARKNWKNSADYQHLPESKTIYVKPEKLN